MLVRKVTLLIVDHDRQSAEDIKITLENARYPNRCISPEVMKIEEVDIGEWDDNHPINLHKTRAAEFSRLFPGSV